MNNKKFNLVPQVLSSEELAEISGGGNNGQPYMDMDRIDTIPKAIGFGMFEYLCPQLTAVVNTYCAYTENKDTTTPLEKAKLTTTVATYTICDLAVVGGVIGAECGAVKATKSLIRKIRGIK